MGFKIQVRRGMEADLPMLENGELGFAEDTVRLYVGSEVGNERISNHRDLLEYVNYTYRDIESLVRDVSYLKLISDTGGRVEGGTTFGTDFVRSYNITEGTAFGIVSAAHAPGQTLLQITNAEDFRVGETVSVYDADSLEECEVVDVTSTSITLNKLTNNYPNGMQVARSMTDNGMFDKRRDSVKTPEGDYANVFASAGLGVSVQNGIRNTSITESGIIVAGVAVGNSIEIRALNMRQASPQWYTAAYINAPVGHVLEKPSITFNNTSDDDGIVVSYLNKTNLEMRVVEVSVNAYQSTNYYAASHVFPQSSPLRSVQSYDITPVFEEGGVTNTFYYVTMSARSDSRPNANNILTASYRPNNTTKTSTFTASTRISDVTDSMTNVSIIPRGYATSIINDRVNETGPLMVVSSRASTNTIELTHETVIGHATKVISGTTSRLRRFPASTYVRRKDFSDPFDLGEIHVVWVESPTNAVVGNVMHTVSLDLGRTWSAPAILATKASMKSAPVITCGAEGAPIVSYVENETIISQTEEDVIQFNVRYKRVGAAASNTLANNVTEDTYLANVYNPNINIERPLVLYLNKNANFLKLYGRFTQDITFPHKTNHYRFRISKLGVELAMWIVREGDVDVQVSLKGVPVDKFGGDVEDEFTHDVSAIQEFDVTVSITREEVIPNDMRRLVSISGGVS